MKWPEFGILSLVTLLSGLVNPTWLPVLPLGPISLNISDIILLILLALVFLRATTYQEFKLFGSPLLLPLLLFIGAFLLSALNAIFVNDVNFNVVMRTVRTLLLWIAFIPTLQLIRDKASLHRFLIGILILAFLLLIGVLFPNKLYPLFPIEVRSASTGSQVYSDFSRFYYAGDMVLYAMIPIVIASLGLKKKGYQWLSIALLGFLFYWLIKTFFRQYWLTLIVVCILLLIFLTGQERLRLFKRFIPVIIVTIIVIISLSIIIPEKVDNTSYILTDRITSLLNDPFKREGSLHWRIIETRYALMQISRHPVLGIGLANRYRPPMENEATTMYSGWAAKYIENGYLYIAVMMGLIGLITFLWLCATYLFRIIKNQHLIKDEKLRAVYLGLGAGFLGMLACNLATPTFVIGTRLIFFPVSMAISEIILRLECKKQLVQ